MNKALIETTTQQKYDFLPKYLHFLLNFLENWKDP